MNDKTSVKDFVEQIANIEPVAVTASLDGIKSCIVFLRVYGADKSEVSDEMLQTSEVSVDGTPAQLSIEFTHDGLNTMDDILLYSSEEVNPDNFEVQIDSGFNTLYNEFGFHAGERAGDELREILEDYCEEVDGNLLREVAVHIEPATSFCSPLEDCLIEVYQIYGHPYYFYTDGGVQEAYRGTDYATEMLRDARYWNSTNEGGSNSGVPA